ncbi:MAG TPA: hypothetical protein VK040_07995 [Balneolaceae bacterium]|nr:hypothetical protein [Balneolaceae bacterium]
MENSQLITDHLLRLLVPEEILEFFEISDVRESEQSIELELRERKELTPEALKGKDVVLDGFCNPIELQSFPLKGKATYIKLFRRRWKPRGQAKHSTNSYDFAQPGTKATRAFGAFLKGSFGLTPTVFQRARHRVMHSRK